MLCSLSQGIRQCVGLLVGKAGGGQATRNRVRIEHQVMLPRAFEGRSRSDEGHSEDRPLSNVFQSEARS